MALTLEVGTDDVGRRLDVVLVRRVDGMSRARARRLIDQGEVRVNGRRTKKGVRLSEGDAVVLEEPPPPTDFDPAPSPELPLEVVLEDAGFVVVAKPPGLPSHPLRAYETRTVVQALLARYPEMKGVGYRRREAGLLHRLDNDTSGVLLAARDAATFEALREQLQGGRIQKRYLALIAGPYLGPDVIEACLAPHASDPRRVRVVGPEARRARPAITTVHRIERRGPFSLLEIDAPVARRHQIRVHLAATGHPLVGDWLYGGPPEEGLDRHLLHASSLGLVHPRTGEAVVAHAPLPADWERLIRRASETPPG